MSAPEREPGSGVAIGGDRRQRKKIQNRRNQRAFRIRNQEKENPTFPKPRVKPRQYQVDRWRLDEDQYRAPTLSQGALDSQNRRRSRSQEPLDQSSAVWFPLPADHLLHLIEYNVFRGLHRNKMMIECLAIQYRTTDLKPEAICDHGTFPSYSVILPLAPHLSGCLTPTQTQMNVVHSNWMNFLPFPAMRDNLIRQEFAFSHSDFIRDLVGEQINLKIFVSTPRIPRNSVDSEVTVTQSSNNETFSATTGLIVWGEPHMTDSWEMTPSFLRKWEWAVRGCEDLIESTNRRRETRGELPLSFCQSELATSSRVTVDHILAE